MGLSEGKGKTMVETSTQIQVEAGDSRMLPTAEPLVSCIMPTANRRRFVPQAIRNFLSQDYTNKELVILDDGDDSVADLIPLDTRLHYAHLSKKQTLGPKRNDCVRASRGDLILHWDDDDWSAPHRLRHQVQAMLQAGAEICGLREMLLHDLSNGQTWLFSCPAHQRSWLAGGSLLYTRDFWQRSPFPNMQVGEDVHFLWSHHKPRLAVVSDYRFYVAMIHPANTSPKHCRGPYWSKWPGDLRLIMGAAIELYQQPVRS